jgi:hypothetical protein
VLYGLTPVVISVRLGRNCPPLPPPIPIPIPMPTPLPIAARARPSEGLVGGTDLGVLSLRAAIVRVLPPRIGGLPCAVFGLLYRAPIDPGPGIVLD